MVPLLSCAVHSSLFHPADLLLDLANERPGLFTHRPPDCVCYTPPPLHPFRNGLVSLVLFSGCFSCSADVTGEFDGLNPIILHIQPLFLGDAAHLHLVYTKIELFMGDFASYAP